MTSEVAEKFWPIYNNYDEKIMDLKEAQMKLRHQKRNGTDEEALKKLYEYWKTKIGRKVYWTALAERGNIIENKEGKYANAMTNDLFNKKIVL